MKPKLLALVPLVLLGAAAGPSADTSRSSGCGEVYVVVRHDTLYSIARRCRDSVAHIAAANRIADPSRIEVGQRLVLAGGASAPKPDEAPVTAAGAGFSYRIAATDTLYSLARWARVRVPLLLAANPGVDPHKIEIGDLIRLPRGAVDPQPLRLRERAPAQAATARAAAPPRRPAMTPRPAPPAPPPARHDDRPPPDDDSEKPDDGNLHGRHQPEGM